MVRLLLTEWPAIVCAHFCFWLQWRCNLGTSWSSLTCFQGAREAENWHSHPLKAELRGSFQHPHLLFPATLPQSSPKALCTQSWEGSYMSQLGDYQRLLSDDRERAEALKPLHPPVPSLFSVSVWPTCSKVPCDSLVSYHKHASWNNVKEQMFQDVPCIRQSGSH